MQDAQGVGLPAADEVLARLRIGADERLTIRLIWRPPCVQFWLLVRDGWGTSVRVSPAELRTLADAFARALALAEAPR
jgi:hypothetical protein